MDVGGTLWPNIREAHPSDRGLRPPACAEVALDLLSKPGEAERLDEAAERLQGALAPDLTAAIEAALRSLQGPQQGPLNSELNGTNAPPLALGAAAPPPRQILASKSKSCTKLSTAPKFTAICAAMCVPAAPRVSLSPTHETLLACSKQAGLRSVILSNTVWRDHAAYWDDVRAFGVAELIDEVSLRRRRRPQAARGHLQGSPRGPRLRAHRLRHDRQHRGHRHPPRQSTAHAHHPRRHRGTPPAPSNSAAHLVTPSLLVAAQALELGPPRLESRTSTRLGLIVTLLHLEQLQAMSWSGRSQIGQPLIPSSLAFPPSIVTFVVPGPGAGCLLAEVTGASARLISSSPHRPARHSTEQQRWHQAKRPPDGARENPRPLTQHRGIVASVRRAPPVRGKGAAHLTST